jgi:FAD/FMN-containing dehydrogenase
VDPKATAFSHRDAGYHFVVLSLWDNRADDQKNLRWARETWESMRPFFSDGVYVNEMGDAPESDARVREAYGADTYRRLAALKKRYDPTNLFRLNPNIKPAP